MEDFGKTLIRDLNIIIESWYKTWVIGMLLGLLVIIVVAKLLSYIAERNSIRDAIFIPAIAEDDIGSVSESNHSQQSNNKDILGNGQQLGVLDPASLMTRQAFLDEIHYAAQKSNETYFATRCVELLRHIFEPVLLAEVINHPLPPLKTTPFLRACVNGNDNLIKYMLKKGANILVNAANGDSPMYLAVFGLITNMHKDLNILETLLQHGAEINAAKDHGYTPLHIAAKNGNMKIIRWLIENGADPEAKMTCGQTPSDEAAVEEHTVAAQYLRVNFDRNLSYKMRATCPGRVQRRTKYRNPGGISQDLFRTTDESM